MPFKMLRGACYGNRVLGSEPSIHWQSGCADPALPMSVAHGLGLENFGKRSLQGEVQVIHFDRESQIYQ